MHGIGPAKAAQIKAAIELVEGQGGIVVGIATIAMDDNAETRVLQGKYRGHAVWQEE